MQEELYLTKTEVFGFDIYKSRNEQNFLVDINIDDLIKALDDIGGQMQIDNCRMTITNPIEDKRFRVPLGFDTQKLDRKVKITNYWLKGKNLEIMIENYSRVVSAGSGKGNKKVTEGVVCHMRFDEEDEVFMDEIEGVLRRTYGKFGLI